CRLFCCKVPGNDQMPKHLGANHRGSRIK
ncbi:putative Poly(A) RNA polymerase GLD2 protein, partial [Naja naja]